MKSGEEPGKRVGPFATEGLIESVMKDRRDKFGDIEMFLQELKKGRGVIKEDILTVGKGFF